MPFRVTNKPDSGFPNQEIDNEKVPFNTESELVAASFILTLPIRYSPIILNCISPTTYRWITIVNTSAGVFIWVVKEIETGWETNDDRPVRSTTL